MTKQKKPEDQIKRFRKAARELGCEDNEERFKEALRSVAASKPKPSKKPEKPPR